MNQNGYFGIGCQNMKTHHNYGSLFRTAQVLDAHFIFMIGARFERQSSDIFQSWKNIPLFEFENISDFQQNRPFDCQLIGIEMSEQAIPIQEFEHPERAAYLLGSEDLGLNQKTLDLCQSVIQLPGEHSLNVAVAGSIVLYDRISKRG